MSETGTTTQSAPSPSTAKGGVRKWVLRSMGCLMALVVLGGGAVFGLSSYILSRKFDFTPPALSVAISNDPVLLERGKHLTQNVLGCADCHDKDLGGKAVIDDGAVGQIMAPNLTTGKGGLGAKLKDVDWVRAIRHGIGHDGRGLVLMPSHDYYPFPDSDIAAVIAYVKSLPPVNRDMPPVSVGPIGRVAILQGAWVFSADIVKHADKRPEAPPPGPTVEYGRLLINVCTGCHGPTLSGGTIPGVPPEWPPAKNITPDKETGIGNWTEADFKKLIRERVGPSGKKISEVMPNFGNMTDDELRALWLCLQQTPAKPYGNR